MFVVNELGRDWQEHTYGQFRNFVRNTRVDLLWDLQGGTLSVSKSSLVAGFEVHNIRSTDQELCWNTLAALPCIIQAW